MPAGDVTGRNYNDYDQIPGVIYGCIGHLQLEKLWWFKDVHAVRVTAPVRAVARPLWTQPYELMVAEAGQVWRGLGTLEAPTTAHSFCPKTQGFE